MTTTNGITVPAISAGHLDGILDIAAPAELFSVMDIQTITTSGNVGTSNFTISKVSGTDEGNLNTFEFMPDAGVEVNFTGVDDKANTISFSETAPASSSLDLFSGDFYVVGYATNALLLSATAPTDPDFDKPTPGPWMGVYPTIDANYFDVLSTSQLAEGTPLSFTATGTLSSFVVACFLCGTHIGTVADERPVEALVPGDLVVTCSGRLAPVKWVGHRSIECRRHPAPAEIWPVRIAKDAFGAGMPRRPLFLSPDHAVFAEGVLIPIKYLINGTTITQQPRDEVTYWHVELAQHDAVFAEGLPCETYLDTGNRSAFVDGGTVTQLHPEFARTAGEAIWEAAACAPLRIEGPAVDRVVSQLRECAGELGFPPVDDERRSISTARVGPTSDLAALLQPAWYLAENPDIAAAGMDPAAHYAGWGRAEGRLPCPEIDMVRGLGLVDPNLFIFTMPDVITAGADPIAHFCKTGWHERRRPNRYFDTAGYLDSYEVPPGMNPLVHYILIGEARGYRPSQHFDPDWYARRYAIGPSISPMAHYLAHRFGQLVSPLASFDVAAYRLTHAATLRPGRDPYAHFLAMGQFAADQDAFFTLSVA